MLRATCSPPHPHPTGLKGSQLGELLISWTKDENDKWDVLFILCTQGCFAGLPPGCSAVQPPRALTLIGSLQKGHSLLFSERFKRQ